MQNKNAENCWEYWDCDPVKRDSCSVFNSNMGKECWVIKNLFSINPSEYNGKHGCWDCPWFKKKSNGFLNE